MLATLVIGLREGLEAALIVGIIAAFLKRNGHSLTPMWWGVGGAIAASLGVGTALWALEASLPQAAQEGLETVIGAVAVVFVTGMVLWMGTHARSLKRDLEASAAEALGAGTAGALAVMAFLAVLKEGFESSVFLLATFRAAVSPVTAAAGALIGIALAVALGIGIYVGGVRLDLARFFRVTGVFLLLVAAGLVLSAVRTAHEAGWLEGGQQRTVDLSWLAPPGSVQASLITGVLGIPADPRLIEVVAWFAYLVPVAVVMFLPDRLMPHGRVAVRLRLITAGVLVVAGGAVAATATAVLAPAPAAPLVLTGSGPLTGTATLRHDALEVGGTTVPLGSGTSTERHGVTTTQRTGSRAAAAAGPATIDLASLMADDGGRLPVGIDPARATGPFAARWTAVTSVTTWTSGGRLLDVTASTRRVLAVSGGGLPGPRVLAVGDPQPNAATTASGDRAAALVQADADAVTERLLWSVQVPLVLALAGALLAAATLIRRRRRHLPASDLRTTGSTSYAVK